MISNLLEATQMPPFLSRNTKSNYPTPSHEKRKAIILASYSLSGHRNLSRRAPSRCRSHSTSSRSREVQKKPPISFQILTKTLQNMYVFWDRWAENRGGPNNSNHDRSVLGHLISITDEFHSGGYHPTRGYCRGGVACRGGMGL